MLTKGRLAFRTPEFRMGREHTDLTVMQGVVEEAAFLSP